MLRVALQKYRSFILYLMQKINITHKKMLIRNTFVMLRDNLL